MRLCCVLVFSLLCAFVAEESAEARSRKRAKREKCMLVSQPKGYSVVCTRIKANRKIAVKEAHEARSVRKKWDRRFLKCRDELTAWFKKESFPDNQLQVMCHSKELLQGFSVQRTRETSYLSAIASASAALAIAKACSQGKLQECSCGHKNFLYRDSSVTEKELYPWRGCQNHILYGLSYSRDFLDPMNERRKHRSIRKLVVKQNNVAGREVYKSKLRPVCKCHGATGSCVTKACWQPLPRLEAIGSELRNRYKSAVEVRMNKRRTKLRAKKNKRYKIKKDDLVYTDSSPDFCEPNKDYGVLGTHGRSCNKTGNTLDRCSILCCGRGYDTYVIRRTFRCHCKFKWCCSVDCKLCTEKRIEYKCK